MDFLNGSSDSENTTAERRRLHNWAAVICSLIMTISSTMVFAQFSPGELSRSHQDLEGPNNCTKCHEVGTTISGRKCLVCHTEIQQTLSSQRGYHFTVSSRACIQCHKEHLGREAATYVFDKKTFDHSQTGFQIEGKHATLECEKCHVAQFITDQETKKLLTEHPHATFLGLDPACNTCHRNPHEEAEKQKCATCHTSVSWNSTRKFDHSTTRYPLLGKHNTVECKQCHVSLTQKTEGTVKVFTVENFADCQTCHKSPHTSKIQAKNCTSCHNEESWNRTVSKTFDHNLTGFVLSGRHASIACEKCHKIVPGASFSSTFLLRHRSCSDCHEDYHHGEFLKKYDNNCSTCHTTLQFKPSLFTVALHNQTNYPLTGSHIAVECQTCHPKKYRTTGQFHFKNLECDGCHGNIHDQNFTGSPNAKGCRSCHQTESWSSITFDHATTKFPLTGKHVTISCVECHKRVTVNQKVSIPFQGLKQFCESCHKDSHNGQFAVAGVTECQRCHAATAWKDSKFDHQTQSKFQITGAHRNVSCTKCHYEETIGGVSIVHYKPLSTECEACHKGKIEK